MPTSGSTSADHVRPLAHGVGGEHLGRADDVLAALAETAEDALDDGSLGIARPQRVCDQVLPYGRTGRRVDRSARSPLALMRSRS
jgi:hypothetical protein